MGASIKEVIEVMSEQGGISKLKAIANLLRLFFIFVKEIIKKGAKTELELKTIIVQIFVEHYSSKGETESIEKALEKLTKDEKIFIDKEKGTLSTGDLLLIEDVLKSCLQEQANEH